MTKHPAYFYKNVSKDFRTLHICKGLKLSFDVFELTNKPSKSLKLRREQAFKTYFV